MTRRHLCHRTRNRQGVRIDTLDAATLEQEMLARIDPGFDVFAETIGECIAMLTRHGGWRLRLGPDPRQALDHFGVMFDVLAGGG